MPVYFNSVVLAGNLTRDPVVKFLANEQAVCNFGLALNRRYKNRDGEMVDDVTFVDIEAWGRLAETCGQYLSKGRACLVAGRLKLESWEKDGQRQSRLRVVAETIQFLSPKEDDATARPAARSSGRAPRDETPGSFDGTPGVPDDEPPF